MMTNKHPLVSVVITTKNEEKNIENCIKSIKSQTYPQDKIELIVVDNNSEDKTGEIAGKYTKNVYNAGPERSAQRNFGVKKSSGIWILYLDADMTLSPNVLSSCVEKVSRDRDLVALYISEVVTGDTYWGRVRRFERQFYDGTAVDCVRFVRKDVFEKVGGFDLTMTGPEDWDFDKKVRSIGKTALVKNPIYHNEGSFNLKKYLDKKAYYAQSFDGYIKKWGKDDSDIKKQFGFWYRYFWVFVENGKWKKLVRYPYLVCSVFFLRFLVGLKFVTRESAIPVEGNMLVRGNKLSFVSVVITTLNEGVNIERCLESIRSQNYPKDEIEVIVVDNNSKDKTISLAKKYTSKVYNLADNISLGDIKNYRGAQLNFGVEKTKGDIIFFPDADMTFDKDLLYEAFCMLKKYDALYVPELIKGESFFGKIRNFERSFYNGTSIDAVRFVKRKVFLEAGGFDVKNIQFGPDDWDFTKTLKFKNYNIGMTSGLLYHHEENMTWGSYLIKKGAYTKTFSGYIRKWGKDDTDIKKQFGVYYRVLGIFLERGNWKKLIRHPLLSICMIMLKFLVGVKYLESIIHESIISSFRKKYFP